jgi:hypothetical protein
VCSRVFGCLQGVVEPQLDGPLPEVETHLPLIGRSGP